MEQMLQRVADDEQTISTLREIARSHLGETVRHRQDVEHCLDLLQADTSALKTGVAAVGEFFKDALASFASDREIKDLLTGYAGEHFEIGCYTAIRTAAESAGHTQIVTVCDRILEDERRAAERILAVIPTAVSTYLAKD